METGGNLLLAFRTAFAQTPGQFVKAWWHDEDVGESALDNRIVACTNAGCADRVHIKEHIHAAVQVSEHSGLQRSVKSAVDLGILEKISRSDVVLKLFLAQEKIILSVNLARPRRACGAGNRVNEILLLAERADERRLSSSRWSGDDEEDAIAVDGEVIQCWRVVPECDRVPISPQ